MDCPGCTATFEDRPDRLDDRPDDGKGPTHESMLSSPACWAVAEVLAAGSLEEHEARVTAWAQSVWQAWAMHHATVQHWCSEL